MGARGKEEIIMMVWGYIHFTAGMEVLGNNDVRESVGVGNRYCMVMG